MPGLSVPGPDPWDSVHFELDPPPVYRGTTWLTQLDAVRLRGLSGLGDEYGIHHGGIRP
jgi:hypothetical protein